MKRTRLVGLSLLALCVALGLGCGASDSCGTDGEISVRCAESLVSGFRPPLVSGYSIKSVYAVSQGQKAVVTLQYAPANRRSYLVVVNVQTSSSSSPDIQGDRVEDVDGLQVTFWETEGSYAAATRVERVLYQVEVLKTPSSASDDLAAVRTSFLKSIADQSVPQ